MFFIRNLCALAVTVALLVGCTGTGITGQDAVLNVVAQARPNTVYVFWPNQFLTGPERLAFYQDDQLVQSVSGGQITALPLSSGTTEYDMSWEEALDVPFGSKVYFSATPDRPQFYIVEQKHYALARMRELKRVSKQELVAEVRKSYASYPNE